MIMIIKYLSSLLLSFTCLDYNNHIFILFPNLYLMYTDQFFFFYKFSTYICNFIYLQNKCFSLFIKL